MAHIKNNSIPSDALIQERVDKAATHVGTPIPQKEYRQLLDKAVVLARDQAWPDLWDAGVLIGGILRAAKADDSTLDEIFDWIFWEASLLNGIEQDSLESRFKIYRTGRSARIVN